MRHTTLASMSSQLSSQIVPHSSSWYTSTRPSQWPSPSTSLIMAEAADVGVDGAVVVDGADKKIRWAVASENIPSDMCTKWRFWSDCAFAQSDQNLHWVHLNSQGCKVSLCGHRRLWPRGYKTFFMLTSTAHEICPANKSQITNNCKFFLAKHSWAWKFLC